MDWVTYHHEIFWYKIVRDHWQRRSRNVLLGPSSCPSIPVWSLVVAHAIHSHNALHQISLWNYTLTYES